MSRRIGIKWNFHLNLYAMIALLWEAPPALSQEEHVHKSHHGGMVVTVGKYHYEMVVEHQAVHIYLLDKKEQTLPISDVTGSVFFHIPGRGTKTVTLSPSGDHFSGAVDLKGVEQFVAVVRLKIEGKILPGRFPYTKPKEHPHTSPHGGDVLSAGNYHAEFVADSAEGEIRFYLYDKAMNSLSAAEASGVVHLTFADGATKSLKLSVAESAEGSLHQGEQHRKEGHHGEEHEEAAVSYLVARVNLKEVKSFKALADLTVRGKKIGKLTFQYPKKEVEEKAHEKGHHEEGGHKEEKHHD